MTTRKISTTIALTLLTVVSSTAAIGAETVTETIQGKECAILTQPSNDIQECESAGKIAVSGNLTLYLFIKKDKSRLAFVTDNTKSETTSSGIVKLPVGLVLEGDGSGSKPREITAGSCTRSEVIPGAKMLCVVKNLDKTTTIAMIK